MRDSVRGQPVENSTVTASNNAIAISFFMERTLVKVLCNDVRKKTSACYLDSATGTTDIVVVRGQPVENTTVAAKSNASATNFFIICLLG